VALEWDLEGAREGARERARGRARERERARDSVRALEPAQIVKAVLKANEYFLVKLLYYYFA